MSKIGKQPIEYDKSKVQVTLEEMTGRITKVHVKGPKGEIELEVMPEIKVESNDNQLVLTRKGDSKRAKAFHGLFRSLIANMIHGVTEGFQKKLEIHGVGYRGEQKGNGIELSLGYSHKVSYNPPTEIEVKMEDPNTISVSGVDKQKVGLVASEIRALKQPEPYKGKGIRYAGEQIRRKAGKAGITG